MARKSVAKRISEGKELSAAYKEAAHLNDTKAHRFLVDMIHKLETGKALSRRQREWFDSLVEAGIAPAPEVDQDILQRIDTAFEALDGKNKYHFEVGVLSDFKKSLMRGYTLSEKQDALLVRIEKKAQDEREGLVWRPVGDELETLRNAMALYDGYAYQWKAERWGLAKSVERIKTAGLEKAERFDYEKVVRAVRAKLRKLDNPRFKSGDIGFSPDSGEPIVCVSDAYVFSGSIVNDWISSGNFVTLIADGVKKRAPKN